MKNPIKIDDLVSHLVLPNIELDNSDKIQNGERVFLPTFQRDSVWKSRQICELWDSMMRGIPLPSLIVSKVNTTNTTKTPAKYNNAIEPKEGDYWLLDGQQRALALLCGFGRNETMQRLWLDIAWTEENEKQHNRRFGFFLCTKARPWGDGINLESRPSPSEVRKARKIIHQEVPLAGCFDFEIELKRTWPISAKAPVPFFPLLNWAVSEPNPITEDSLKEKLKNEKLKAEMDKLSETHSKQPDELCVKNLTHGLNKLRNTKITLVEAEVDDEDLLTTFTRLNRNGTKVNEDELFYSGIKKSMPDSYTLISSVIKEHPVFSEIDLLRGFTILASQGRDNETNKWLFLNTSLTVEFLLTLQRKEGQDSFLNTIKHNYLDNNKANELAKLTIQSLRHEANKHDDKGLPLIMLPRLRVRTWLPILRWLEISKQKEISPVSDEEREALLRYALTAHFFADWEPKADEFLRELIDLVTKCAREKKIFPSTSDILQEFQNIETKEGGQRSSVWLKILQVPGSETGTRTIPLPLPLSPSDIEVRNRRHGKRHHWPARSDGHLWMPQHGTDLLMWSQRKVLDEWFETQQCYECLPILSETGSPWDKDHIVPSDFFNHHGAVSDDDAKEALRKIMEISDQPEISWEKIKSMRGETGNIRLWPLGFNRKDGDMPAAGTNNKLTQDPPEENEDYLVLSHWWRKHAENNENLLKQASCIEDNQPWEQTPDKKVKWTKENIESFLNCIKLRQESLYKNLWDFIKDGLPEDMKGNRL